LTLLPKDADKSAERIRNRLMELTGGLDVAVIVSDSFGRPWRIGQVDLAIGVSGMKPLRDYRGEPDMFGRPLSVTILAIADELASASELAMNKSDGTPAVIIRGYGYEKGNGGAKRLRRPDEMDLFI